MTRRPARTALEEGVEAFNRGDFSAAARLFRAAIKNWGASPDAVLFLAHSLRSLGDQKAAERCLKRLLKATPGHPQAIASLVDILWSEGRHKEAVAWSRRAAASRPKDAQVRRLRDEAREMLAVQNRRSARTPLEDGVEAFNRGDFAAAARLFRAAIKEGSATPDAVLFLAHSLRSLGDQKAAARCLKRLLKETPGHPRASLALVDILWCEGRHEEAVAWSKRAVAAHPEDAQVRRLRDEAQERLAARCLDRARARVGKGDWLGAERRLRSALQLEAASGPILRELTNLLLDRAREGVRRKRWLEAERWLRKAIAVDPRPELVRELKETLREGAADLAQLGRRDESRKLLERALADDRGRVGRMADGAERFRALVGLGRYRDAFALGERLLDRGPSLADTRAFCNPWDGLPAELLLDEHLPALDDLLARGSFTPWAELYRIAITGEFPDGALDRFARLPPERFGWMALKIGPRLMARQMFEESLPWLERALKFQPFNWWGRGHLAEGLICLGREEDARAQMRLAVSEAPAEEKASALSWKGELDLWLGRYQEALATLEEACRGDAEMAWCWRGAALLQLGRLEEGVAVLDEAVKRRPQDVEAYVWRGEGKRRLGRHHDALKDLDRRPIGFWARVNRGLVKATLRDEAGLRAEFSLLPVDLAGHIQARLGLEGAPDADAMAKILEEAVATAKGFRREDYGQRSWAR